MPSLTAWASFCAVVLPFCPCGQCYPRDQSNHMAAPVKVATQQTTPELSGTFRTLPPEPTPKYTRTLRNLPEPSGTCLRNLHRFTPELSGTFRNLPRELTPFYKGTLRNLPEPASGTYTSTLRNSPKSYGTFRNLPPEPTPFYTGTLRNLPGTCLGNLHHFTKELSGTFRNLPPEPTPAHSGTLRNLPEPSSGTGSCDPHRHTPELIWAKDPISLRCWGKISFGGIPNSSNIILMPRLTTWAPFF